MHPKTILARLHCALDPEVRVDRLLLLPRLTQPTVPQSHAVPCSALVVGYTGSPNSQAALDLAFCVAHQMQLATRQQATIHVVYVVDCPDTAQQVHKRRSGTSKVDRALLTSTDHSAPSCGTAVLKRSKAKTKTGSKTDGSSLDQIDQVLWQARCLAEEWRGSFSAHLRFGSIATELTSFVHEEKAGLLFLGCHDVQHPLVQALKAQAGCPVVGIPDRELRN